MGINPVLEALEGNTRVHEVWVVQGKRNKRIEQALTAAAVSGVAVVDVDEAAIERLAGVARHQGIAAHVAVRAPLDEQALPKLLEANPNGLWLLLDGVTDPHNLGACMRSAAAAGAVAVIIPKDRAVSLTPVARKAAAGASERLPLVRVTNLVRTMQDMQQAGVWFVGLAGEGDQSLFDVDLTAGIGLVMGAEGDGLRRLTRETCDYLARIPMPGESESLNVSVAAGVSLFEAVRQRQVLASTSQGATND